MNHRRFALGIVGLALAIPTAAVLAQATLDHDQLTNGVGVFYYDWPGQNFHAGTQTHASYDGVTFSDELVFGWSEDGLAGDGRAVQTTTYAPANPGPGGPIHTIAIEMYGEAEITESNYQNHFTEQAYGNPDNFIWFHLDETVEWTWEADVTGRSSSGYDINGFYVFILYDSNFGNVFTDSLASHNGVGNFESHRSAGGKLDPGDYIINVAAGGNVGTYRLGGGPGTGTAHGSLSNGLLTLGNGACSADLDGNGTLDLFDFLAFVNLFNAGDPAADCTKDGTFDLFDFLCFVNAFNTGC